MASNSRIYSADKPVGPVYSINLHLKDGVEVIVRSFNGFTLDEAERIEDELLAVMRKVMAGGK